MVTLSDRSTGAATSDAPIPPDPKFLLDSAIDVSADVTAVAGEACDW
jgi:hypothetical protein